MVHTYPPRKLRGLKKQLKVPGRFLQEPDPLSARMFRYGADPLRRLYLRIFPEFLHHPVRILRIELEGAN